MTLVEDTLEQNGLPQQQQVLYGQSEDWWTYCWLEDSFLQHACLKYSETDLYFVIPNGAVSGASKMTATVRVMTYLSGANLSCGVCEFDSRRVKLMTKELQNLLFVPYFILSSFIPDDERVNNRKPSPYQRFITFCELKGVAVIHTEISYAFLSTVCLSPSLYLQTTDMKVPRTAIHPFNN
jgi:hypothetical protein